MNFLSTIFFRMFPIVFLGICYSGFVNCRYKRVDKMKYGEHKNLYKFMNFEDYIRKEATHSFSFIVPFISVLHSIGMHCLL